MILPTLGGLGRGLEGSDFRVCALGFGVRVRCSVPALRFYRRTCGAVV